MATPFLTSSLLLSSCSIYSTNHVCVEYFFFPLCKTIPFRVCCSYFSDNMANANTSFKKALLSPNLSSSNPTSKDEEADVVIGALDSSDSAEEAWDEDLCETNVNGENQDVAEERDLEYEAYVQTLSKVKKDIRVLEATCLIGAMWNGIVKIMKLKNKLKADWKFVKGDIEVVDRTNNWFEIQFASGMDRDLVWECRPFHVFGLLLVLMPWKANFDPTKEVITHLDFWIRIPFLPTEFMSSEMIKAIIEYNKIGTFIKLDPYSENRSRPKYAWVCVNVPNVSTYKGYVILPNLHNSKEKQIFTVWYEDESEGRRNCGVETHLFDSCPFRNPVNRVIKVVIEKRETMAAKQSVPPRPDTQVNDNVMDDAWIDVSKRKGKKPIINTYQSPSTARKERPIGKGLKIWENDTDMPRKVFLQAGNTGKDKGDKSFQKADKGPLVAITPTTAATVDAIVPSITSECFIPEPHQQQNLYPVDKVEMAGLDTTIYDFCGGLPLGSIQDEGGYLLQDVIKSCGTRKEIMVVNLDGEAGEDTDVSYKSTHSRSSMVVKMTKMSVKKDDMSVSDSGKRKPLDGEDDTASSSVKRHKNVDP